MTVVGVSGWGGLLIHEVLTGLLGPIPGALGLLLRRIWYPLLFRDVGRGVVFGRNLMLRHTGRITLGDRVVLDDGVVLDGRSGNGIVLGDEVVVNRGASLHAKDGSIRVGAHSDIGAGSTLNSPGVLEVGRMVTLGGDCHLGGRSMELGRGPDEGADPGSEGTSEARPNDPAARGQDRFTRGGVHLGDRCLLGGGVHVLDGVRMGEGCVVGAGVVVREDVPPDHVVMPRERPVSVPRALFDRRRPEPGPAPGQRPRRPGRPRSLVDTDEAARAAEGGATEEAGGAAEGGTADEAASASAGTGRAASGAEGTAGSGRAAAVATSLRERSERVVAASLERLNEQLPPDGRLRLEPDAPMLKPEGPLDSLGVVNLLVTLEEAAEREFGRPVELVDSARVAEGRVPFSTPAALARHVCAVVGAGRVTEGPPTEWS